MKRRLGLIINPVAGMGGRVGLKGSDGEEIQKRARELGASQDAGKRASEALEKLTVIKDGLEIITFPYDMGEDICKALGFEYCVNGSIEIGKTTSKDTVKAVEEMLKQNVELLLFAGGDGTARNIFDASANSFLPVIGIPAGVKIHSAVYATNPRNAGEAALNFLQGKVKKLKDSEVMDIDEEAFREGRVTAKLYGYLKVPEEQRLLQGLKSGRPESDAAALGLIANYIVDCMEMGVLYIIGPGTTTRAVMDKLGLKNTLLGVDVIMDKKLVANDVTEMQLLELVKGKKTKIIVTVIGGQGYIFGRGNQQLSPNVLRMIGKENIIVITPQDKLAALGGRPLLIDTGDYEVNSSLSGYYRAITGYQRSIMYRAE